MKKYKLDLLKPLLITLTTASTLPLITTALSNTSYCDEAPFKTHFAQCISNSTQADPGKHCAEKLKCTIRGPNANPSGPQADSSKCHSGYAEESGACHDGGGGGK